MCLVGFGQVSAQTCGSNMYGLTTGGLIYSVNPTNASVTTTSLNSTPPTGIGTSLTTGPNAMGYNPSNGKFYFWAATTYSVSGNAKKGYTYTNPEFVSYDPTNSTTPYQYLSIMNSAGTSTPGAVTINSGCVSQDGLGYYCINANGALWYYDILANNWTAIDSTWKDQSGTDISSNIKANTGGDMAIDGGGNLWLMVANSTNLTYGLYEISALLPRTTVSSITLKQYLPYNTPDPDHSTIAGIAFSNTGQIYISSLSDSLYVLNSAATAPFYVGKFNVTGVGMDLTSCAFPTTVLPVRFTNFMAKPAGTSNVTLRWEVNQGINTKTYSVEHSTDSRKWETIGNVASNQSVGLSTYSFNYSNAVEGRHFYRIVEVDADGYLFYSAVIKITIGEMDKFTLWPSPSAGVINIQNYNVVSKAQIVNASGLMVAEKLLPPGVTSINVSALPKGCYLVRVEQSNGPNAYLKFTKE